MNLSTKLIPFLVVPVLAMGCAAPAEDEEVGGGEAAIEVATSAKAELGAAIGALVVNGERLCTAALVKAEAGAKVRVNGVEVEAEGRQIVFGGACVGKLSAKHSDFLGAAVFVGQRNGLTIKTPIVSFDFESRASAGLAVGILAEKSKDEPIEILGLTASAHVGAETAAVFSANEDGLLVGSGFAVSGGFDVALKTKCTSFKAGAHAAIGASASLQLADGTALIKVKGKFRLAAYIDVKVDGQCIVARTVERVNAVGDKLNSLGTGDVVSMAYHPGPGREAMSVYLDKPVNVLRLNSQGFIRAKAGGTTCTKIPLLIAGGPCELAPEGGFSRGLHTIEVNLGPDFVPNPAKGQLVVFSTADELFAKPQDNDANGGGG
jgi:hypothetical protein